MAEMKIKSGPLKLTVKDDRGRVVADLRYPKVRWSILEIESEDELDAVVLSERRVRLVRRVPAEETAAGDARDEGDSGHGRGTDWDPFRDFEFGVRDFLTRAGKAVEDFLEDLNEWSGPVTRPRERRNGHSFTGANGESDEASGTSDGASTEQDASGKPPPE
jgi:hypothetical protein